MKLVDLTGFTMQWLSLMFTSPRSWYDALELITIWAMTIIVVAVMIFTVCLLIVKLPRVLQLTQLLITPLWSVIRMPYDRFMAWRRGKAGAPPAPSPTPGTPPPTPAPAPTAIPPGSAKDRMVHGAIDGNTTILKILAAMVTLCLVIMMIVLYGLNMLWTTTMNQIGPWGLGGLAVLIAITLICIKLQDKAASAFQGIGKLVAYVGGTGLAILIVLMIYFHFTTPTQILPDSTSQYPNPTSQPHVAEGDGSDQPHVALQAPKPWPDLTSPGSEMQKEWLGRVRGRVMTTETVVEPVKNFVLEDAPIRIEWNTPTTITVGEKPIRVRLPVTKTCAGSINYLPQNDMVVGTCIAGKPKTAIYLNRDGIVNGQFTSEWRYHDTIEVWSATVDPDKRVLPVEIQLTATPQKK